MFEIIVLICNLNQASEQCTPETARSTWIVGEADTNLSCMLQGALNVASTKIEINDNEYIKFECVEKIRL
jgi:hypothetical protein